MLRQHAHGAFRRKKRKKERKKERKTDRKKERKKERKKKKERKLKVTGAQFEPIYLSENR